MAYRYAVYAAPAPASELARFAASWLGYDAATGTDMTQPTVAGIPSGRLAELTQSPRRYGFHGTLKAPFRPAEGIAPSDLHGAVEAVASDLVLPVDVPLKLGDLGGFLALVPTGPVPALDALAARCVQELDHLRAPLNESELARRNTGKRSALEQRLLDRWGYPYVLEAFRYHMTLTERLKGDEHKRLFADLSARTANLVRQPWRLDALCVFEQENPDSRFRIAARYPFGLAP